MLPSGRRFTLSGKSAIGTTDDHHWPKLDDPCELGQPNVELNDVKFGRYPSYVAALDAANQQLALMGVAPERIESWDRRLRESHAPHQLVHSVAPRKRVPPMVTASRSSTCTLVPAAAVFSFCVRW